MNAREQLSQHYTVSAIPIPNTPQWYRVRFDPTSHNPETRKASDGRTAKDAYVAASEVAYAPAAEAIVAPTQEAAFVRWNTVPHDDGVSQEVFEAEACHQARAAHQKRLAI